MHKNQVAPTVVTQPGRQDAPGQTGQYGHMAMPAQQAGIPVQQPLVWMPKPQGPVGCPPGLEYLTQVDQVLIKQQIELFEVFTNWEVQNRYRLLNSVGQQVYFAQEESGACERQCCRANRSFTMHITDNIGAEVITVHREFRYWKDNNWCACCDCCAHQITIEAPTGNVVGYVKQRASFCAPKYVILDADQKEVFYIEGPCYMGCVGGCPCDINFRLLSAKDGETEVGAIQKQWGNLLQEVFTTADNFGVKFPMDLDVKMKAAVIGATFLIDFMYFETPRGGQTRYY